MIYCSGSNVIWRPVAGMGAEKPEDILCWKSHTKKTTCAAMSPNGQWVLSGDTTGAVRLWGAKGEHAQKSEYKLWSGTVKDVSWSDDSTRIFACGDGKEVRAAAMIWDTGSKTGEVGGHTKQVNSISFRSQRPFRVVTGSEDMQVAFHQGPPFKFLKSHSTHSNFVNCVRYSPDGNWVLSAGSDSKVCVYEGKDGELVKEFAKPAGISGSLWFAAWSSDSARIVTAGGDKKIRVWDRESGAQTSEAAVGTALSDMQIGVSWATESRIISVSLDGRIFLWEVSPDGQLSLAGTVDGTQGPLNCVGCDRKTGSLIYGGTEGTVAVLGSSAPRKVSIGKGISHILSHSEAYTGDPEAWIISLDDCLRRLSLTSTEVLGTPVEIKEFVVGADWMDTAETKMLVATSKNNVICVSAGGIEWSKAAVPRRPTAMASRPGPPGLMAVAVEKPDGMVAGVASSQFDIMLFEVKDASADGIVEKAVLQKHSGEVCGLSFSPSGAFLASSDALNKVVVWSLGSEAPVVKVDWSFHTARVTCLDWLANGKLVSGSLDCSLFVWDPESPASKVKVAAAHKGGVSAVAACPDGGFASVGHDGFVLVHSLS